MMRPGIQTIVPSFGFHNVFCKDKKNCIIQKIFFQHGGGRQESALYKGGYSQKYDKELIDKILSATFVETL